MNKIYDDTYIKPNKLKDKYLYRIKAHNALYGIWVVEDGEFIISRFKCGENYLFEEIHWDLSEDFGTAKPLYEIEKCPFETFTNEQKVLNYLNSKNDLHKARLVNNECEIKKEITERHRKH